VKELRQTRTDLIDTIGQQANERLGAVLDGLEAYDRDGEPPRPESDLDAALADLSAAQDQLVKGDNEYIDPPLPDPVLAALLDEEEAVARRDTVDFAGLDPDIELAFVERETAENPPA